MGRTEPSTRPPPAKFRRDARAKQAKATVNHVIPAMLLAHSRARHGIEKAELIVDPPRAQLPEADKGSVAAARDTFETDMPRLSLRTADTLVAARETVQTRGNRTTNMPTRVAILNMASPLSPGGGFFNGANSQEESLCMRTTVLPSLKDEYYRLPEVGAIYTPDVLVFRDETAKEVLNKKDRWFVDFITAAMLRQPDTERDEMTGRSNFVHEQDRELVLRKMRMILRICQAKGIDRIILGAWGCGAYGNPLGEVAAAWRKVLIPKDRRQKRKNHSSPEPWHGIEEIVFAIKDRGMAKAFSVAFGDGLHWRDKDDFEDSETDANDTDDQGSEETEASEGSTYEGLPECDCFAHDSRC